MPNTSEVLLKAQVDFIGKQQIQELRNLMDALSRGQITEKEFVIKAGLLGMGDASRIFKVLAKDAAEADKKIREVAGAVESLNEELKEHERLSQRVRGVTDRPVTGARRVPRVSEAAVALGVDPATLQGFSEREITAALAASTTIHADRAIKAGVEQARRQIEGMIVNADIPRMVEGYRRRLDNLLFGRGQLAARIGDRGLLVGNVGGERMLPMGGGQQMVFAGQDRVTPGNILQAGRTVAGVSRVTGVRQQRSQIVGQNLRDAFLMASAGDMLDPREMDAVFDQISQNLGRVQQDFLRQLTRSGPTMARLIGSVQRQSEDFSRRIEAGEVGTGGVGAFSRTGGRAGVQPVRGAGILGGPGTLRSLDPFSIIALAGATAVEAVVNKIRSRFARQPPAGVLGGPPPTALGITDPRRLLPARGTPEDLAARGLRELRVEMDNLRRSIVLLRRQLPAARGVDRAFGAAVAGQGMRFPGFQVVPGLGAAGAVGRQFGVAVPPQIATRGMLLSGNALPGEGGIRTTFLGREQQLRNARGQFTAQTIPRILGHAAFDDLDTALDFLNKLSTTVVAPGGAAGLIGGRFTPAGATTKELEAAINRLTNTLENVGTRLFRALAGPRSGILAGQTSPINRGFDFPGPVVAATLGASTMFGGFGRAGGTLLRGPENVDPRRLLPPVAGPSRDPMLTRSIITLQASIVGLTRAIFTMAARGGLVPGAFVPRATLGMSSVPFTPGTGAGGLLMQRVPQITDPRRLLPPGTPGAVQFGLAGPGLGRAPGGRFVSLPPAVRAQAGVPPVGTAVAVSTRGRAGQEEALRIARENLNILRSRVRAGMGPGGAGIGGIGGGGIFGGGPAAAAAGGAPFGGGRGGGAFGGRGRPGTGFLGRIFPGDNRRFRGFATAVRTVGQFAGASAIIFTVANAFRDAAGAALQFEDAMARIQGVLPSRSFGERIQIKKSVIQAARDYSVDLLQAAESAKIFAQQGLSAEEVSRELGATLLATMGAGLDPIQAREMLTAVRNITDEQVSSFDILDRISRIESRRAIDASSLADALKQAGPLAQQLNGDFQGLVGALDVVLGVTTQIVEETRVSGRQAATSLRFILARLGRPQIIKQLEDLGGVRLATQESAGKQLRPLVEILEELASAFARLKEEGSAEATKFLVALAGARQVNPAAILLTNVAEAIETARLGAIAWGDTQERLAIQQQTFRAHLTRFTTELRLLAIGFVETSGAGDSLKWVFDTLTSGMRTFGDGSDLAVVKIAAMTASFFALGKVLASVNTAFKFLAISGAANVFGRRIATTAGAFGVGRAVAGSPITSRLVRGGARLGAGAALGGIGAALGGPQAAATVALLGLAGAIALIVKSIKDMNAVSPLAIDFFDQLDVKPEETPRIGRFQDLAATLDTDSDTLLRVVQRVAGIISSDLRQALDVRGLAEGANFTVPLIDNLVALRDELGITRTELIDQFINLVSRELPQFSEFVLEGTESLDGFQKQALITARVMETLGNAVFLASGVITANLNKVTQQFEDIQGQLTSALTRLDIQEDLQEVFDFTEFFPRAVSQGLLGFGTGAGPLEDAIETMFEGTQEGIGELFRQLLIIDPKILTDAVQAATDVFGRDRGTAEEFFRALSATFAGAARDPARREEMIKAITELFSAALDAQGAEPLSIGIAGGRGIFDPMLIAMNELIPEAAERLRQDLLLGKFDIQDPDKLKEFERLLISITNGAQVASSDLSEAFAKIRNPIDDFVRDFFIAEQRILANADAALQLGLAFDIVGDQLENAERFGRRLFGLRLDILDPLLQNISEFTNVRTLGGTQRGQAITEFLDFVKGENLSFLEEGTPVQDVLIGLGGGSKRLAELTTEIDALSKMLAELETRDFLKTFDPERFEAAGGIVNFIQAFVQDTAALQAILDDPTSVRSQEQLEAFGAIANRVSVSFGLLVDAFKEVLDIRRAAGLAQRGRILDVEREATIAKSRLDAEKEIQAATIQSAATLANTELPLALQVATARTRIAQSRNLEILTAQRVFEIETQTARARAEADPEFAARQLGEELQDAQDRLTVALAEADITAFRLNLIERIRLAEQESAAFTTQVLNNTQARLQGLKEVLTDFNTLVTSPERIFEAAGTDFIKRQGDLLFKNLFSRGGLLEGAGQVIGLAGEVQSPIISAHIQGATEGAQIYASTIAAALGGGVGGVGGIGGVGGVSGPAAAAALAFGVSPETMQRFAAQQTQQAFATTQRQQVIQSVASIVGSLGGAAVGGGGRGAQIGGQFGAFGGTLAGAQLGAFGGPVGAIAGGLVGGLIGGLFDKEEKQFRALEIIARSSEEQVTLLENTNRLLDPNQIAFNLPTGFRLPAFTPQGFGAGEGNFSPLVSVSNNKAGGNVAIENTFQMEITTTGADAAAVGREIASAVSAELTTQLGANGLFVSRR